MATTLASPSSSSTQPSPRQHQFLDPNSPPQQHRRLISRQRFINDFSQCLYEFVVQLLPTAEEMAVKEDVRKLLERLIRTIEPNSRLLSFGSSANGFSLKNSDMDLCCLIDSEERLNASDLVTMVGDLLERETKFHVKPLPHARIPIVKLTLDPSPALPFGIACDIGFENRLALENTRLLMCYASIDPARVRTMVLFLKVWSKRRKINSPYKGTLSSYGYVLLVIYFLVHVKNPPVLPNLQQMPPLRPISEEETHLNGYNIWFFDDIELLRQRWKSSNTETVAELLIDFFRYYSRDFAYNTSVASIRAGLLKKETKGWFSEDFGTGRERNRLCIEDPFETDFNVARCVTKDGLYTIRGEFMRALRILQARPDRAILALAQLCEERKDETLGPPPPKQRTSNGPPRLTSIPPQTPYTVGSSPMRPNITVPALEEVASPNLPSQGPSSPASPSPLPRRDSPGRSTVSHSIPMRLPVDKLDHMAPIRGKWTSPPPPEAPEEDRSAYEDRLGWSLALATASNSSRLSENAYASSNNSETHTDDERQSIADSDDVRSVKSYVEEGAVFRSREWRDRHPAGLHHKQRSIQQQYGIDQSTSVPTATQPANFRLQGDADVKMMSRLRGRPASRLALQTNAGDANAADRHAQNDRSDGATPPPRMDTPRRSMSFPVRNVNRFSLPTMPIVVPNHLAAAAYYAHVSPPMHYTAPRYALHAAEHSRTNGNVYYEAVPPRERERMYRAMATRPDVQAQHAGLQPQSERIASYGVNQQGEPMAGPSHLSEGSQNSASSDRSREGRGYSHRHSHSNTTVTAPTPPANVPHFPAAVSGMTLGPRHAQSHSQSQSHSRSRSPPFLSTQRNMPPPYQYAQQQQFSSPRSTAANLPPRFRAERERSFGTPEPRSFTHTPLPPHIHTQAQAQPEAGQPRASSPLPSHSSGSGSASPPMSCASSQYAASSSPLSTSPPSPAQSETKATEAPPPAVSPLKTAVPLVEVPTLVQAEVEKAPAVEVPTPKAAAREGEYPSHPVQDAAPADLDTHLSVLCSSSGAEGKTARAAEDVPSSDVSTEVVAPSAETEPATGR
ncbi:hypothetical protein BN946_scf184823.g13 [Trametes cinnabarina]|uniref:polynucleotide adenylyltransferase n=1 Tax=Pycnoporus cinnabarinus TaxID=5643 RepID=A0A060STB1_PYCCI|nr:hypothetical protein BN946_scf184823.g13 [Trametes cinnabarina]